MLLVFSRSTLARRCPVVISVGRCVDGAVAIDALDRRRVARLAVELAVAVHVDVEMAIDALHAVREMDVLEVHRLRELLRIVVRDLVVLEVEQVAFAILLEDGAEDPAVAVVVGELRVLQLRIQLRDSLEEIQIAPQAARRRRLGIALRRAAPARRRSDRSAPSDTSARRRVSWSHQV